MPKGRLYLDATGAESIVIDYKLIDASANSWWGELTLEDFRRIQDGGGYIIEFADGVKGNCMLNKKINKAVSGLLPLYCYRFRGMGPVYR
jgi:hypothetical protein